MLTHIPSAIAVFQSGEYKNFTMIIGNRDINTKKIDKIIKEIEEGNDMLNYYPIIVRVVEGKLLILDGQHRFIICKKLKRPVHYIIATEERTMVDIARVNSNTEKWKAINFINCYQLHDNENYKLIKQFVEEFGFSLGLSLNLLTNGSPGSVTGGQADLMNEFEKGNFIVKTYDEAVAFGNKCKLFSAFKNWRSRHFLIAISRVLIANKINFDEVVAAYNKSPDELKQQVHFKDYIINLEAIINTGKRNRIIIT